ncbi:MAG: DMT family transporter [Pseudomonadota bacterium]
MRRQRIGRPALIKPSSSLDLARRDGHFRPMSQRRDTTDWVLFGALSILWASAYAMTRGAVETLPVGVIIPARLIIGAIVLNIAVLVSGGRYPPLADLKRWGIIVLMGFVGMTGPFSLITTAQQTVDSSLAALYVAATPIFVVIGANAFFADERLTLPAALGIGTGFLGVGVLFAPDIIENYGSATAIAQGLLLLATMCYASSTLIARGAPTMQPLVFAAGFVTAAAVLSLPMLIGVNWPDVEPSTGSVLSVIGLGIGPSALASLLYMALVQRAGATFLSLTGYAIPILSAIIGWIVFQEQQSWNTALAFGLILGGVWLAQRPARSVAPKGETAPQ